MGNTHLSQHLLSWTEGLDEFLSIETTVALCFHMSKQSIVLQFLFSSLGFSPSCRCQIPTLSSHARSDTLQPRGLSAPLRWARRCPELRSAEPGSAGGWRFAPSPGKMGRAVVFPLEAFFFGRSHDTYFEIPLPVVYIFPSWIPSF